MVVVVTEQVVGAIKVGHLTVALAGKRPISQASNGRYSETVAPSILLHGDTTGLAILPPSIVTGDTLLTAIPSHTLPHIQLPSHTLPQIPSLT